MGMEGERLEHGRAFQRPVVNLEGECAALGPLRRDLVETYARWESDFSSHAGRGVRSRPYALEREQEAFERAAREESRTFTIYETETWRPVGLAWLSEIEPVDGTATYSIYLGEADRRGVGLGTEVTRLMLGYAFGALQLFNVMLTVASFNQGAMRAYEKAGFREFGRRTGSYRVGGERWDDVYMQCLAAEWAGATPAGNDHI